MRAIIGTLRYDTERAKRLHTWDNGKPKTSPERREKTLYVTEAGRFFVHHTGRIERRVRREAAAAGVALVGTADTGHIEPLSEERALQWATLYNAPATVVEHYFSAQVEDA